MSAGFGSVVIALAVAVWAWSERAGQVVERATITASSIVVLGDSITEQGPWSSALTDLPISNRGYDAYTTAQLVDVAADVAAARPVAVFILTGANDIRDDNPPQWTVRHLTTILDEFAREAPDTRIVIQTILPWGDRSTDVEATNTGIVELADEREIEVLDLHRVFDDGTGALAATDTFDGLHLSDAGNERWAEVLRPELAQR